MIVGRYHEELPLIVGRYHEKLPLIVGRHLLKCTERSGQGKGLKVGGKVVRWILVWLQKVVIALCIRSPAEAAAD